MKETHFYFHAHPPTHTHTDRQKVGLWRNGIKWEGGCFFYLILILYSNRHQRIFYLSRNHDAGVLSVGIDPNWKHIVPPGQRRVVSEAHCVADCTQQALPSRGINVFAVNQHTHLLGTSLIFFISFFVVCVCSLLFLVHCLLHHWSSNKRGHARRVGSLKWFVAVEAGTSSASSVERSFSSRYPLIYIDTMNLPASCVFFLFSLK